MNEDLPAAYPVLSILSENASFAVIPISYSVINKFKQEDHKATCNTPNSDNIGFESHAPAGSPFKAKRPPYEEHNDTDEILLSARMKHISGTQK
ncbi:hypothetical protein DITRI_Ditri01bG0177300 [Diplodiscus trichospermus]